MIRLLLTGTILTCSLIALAQVAPPEEVLLPDGTPFAFWEDSTEYSRIYYVDQAHVEAADDNTGSQAAPFATIGRAAELLQPGEKVIIKEGNYREWVHPARGGRDARSMIAYEAAAGDTVVITGTEAVSLDWNQTDDALWRQSAKDTSGIKEKVWTARLGPAMFTTGNPFAKTNITSWMLQHFSKSAGRNAFNLDGMGRYFSMKRGMMFQNDRRLKQVAEYFELYREDAAGSFWVEDDGLTVHLRSFGDVSVPESEFEITAREQCFSPEVQNLGYVRLSGLTVERGGNAFPISQKGLISTLTGHHWIVEDCTIRQANSLGLDIGQGHWNKTFPDIYGHHIIRRNDITECGIGAIAGLGAYRCLIEDNYLADNAYFPVEPAYESAAIKTHYNEHTLIRRNRINNTLNGSGIWMDYMNRNSRCTENIITNTQSTFGAIFLEASYYPNLIDHNVILGTSNSGIYQHDCDSLWIVHNLIADAGKDAIKMRSNEGREHNGRLFQARNNRIFNNLIVDSDTVFNFSDTINQVDHNLLSRSSGVLHRDTLDQPEWHRHLQYSEVDLEYDPARPFEYEIGISPYPTTPLLLSRDMGLKAIDRTADNNYYGPFRKPPGE